MLKRLRDILKRDFMRAVIPVLNRNGYQVFRREPDYQYSPTFYSGTHSKKIDIREIQPFRDLADKVIKDGRTFLKYDRLYILYQAISNLQGLSAGGQMSLAEVGVFRGGGTYFIASVANMKLGPKPKVYGFDTFEGHPDDIDLERDVDHRAGNFNETSYETVKSYLTDFDNVTLYQGRIQNTCHNVAGEKFCFAHIDVDIYHSTADALAFFDSVLIPGGIMVVDDYGFTSCVGARQAVDEFAEARPDYVKLHLTTGQCLLVRLGGHPG